LGLLAEEELVLARAAGVRVGATGLIVENEAALASTIARTRLYRPLTESPKLYILENGVKNTFAEVISPTTLRWVHSGQSVTLPGRLYSVRNGLVNINLRNGPGKGFAVYKTIPANRLLIVLEENSGWCKVQLDNSTIGWVSAALISQVDINNPDSSQQNIKPKSTSIFRLNEIRFIAINDHSSEIEEIMNIMSDTIAVTTFSEEQNPVPINAANRLKDGITTRYFDNNDYQKAVLIKKIISDSSELKTFAIFIENMLPAFGNKVIPSYIKIWLK
jgi:hypothetical protein